MMSIYEDDERNFVPCRAEVLSPTTDWELSWSNCRQPGVSTELASFLWLMLHNLLSTQARLHRMGAVRTAKCKMQDCIEDGTLQHELLLCSKNEGVGKLLLTCLQQHIPDLQPAKLLRLEFGDFGQDLSLAMTWLTAIILKHIWKKRETGSSIRVYKVRAELEQYITLLRTTRLQEALHHLSNFKREMFSV